MKKVEMSYKLTHMQCCQIYFIKRGPPVVDQWPAALLDFFVQRHKSSGIDHVTQYSTTGEGFVTKKCFYDTVTINLGITKKKHLR